MSIDTSLTAANYTFIDGQSAIQRNAYDCGVFSLMNVEKYVTGRPDNHPVVQPLMKLYRLRILRRLYGQSQLDGTVE